MGASDVHLFCGLKPRIRIDGSLEWLEDYPEVDEKLIDHVIGEVLTEKQAKQFDDELELDTGFSVPGLGRFRGNFLMEAKGRGCVFRLVPTEIPSLDEISMPPIITEMAQHHQGLVLVTGPTGSGKSTTLAAMVNLINKSRRQHIITIEDPIEFIHPSLESTVTQREVGKDTKGFLVALRSALREDPDVILVGELRDYETMGMALRAAETGHLVLSTLHTTSCVGTINRFVETFPTDSHDQVRLQLAQSLKGVVSQRLLPRADERGRIACVEIMILTPAVSALIREGKTHQIQSLIQTGRKLGMQLFDLELLDLVSEGIITQEVAIHNCRDKDSFIDSIKKYVNTPKGRRMRAHRPTWKGGHVEEIRASSKRRTVQDRLQIVRPSGGYERASPDRNDRADRSERAFSATTPRRGDRSGGAPVGRAGGSSAPPASRPVAEKPEAAAEPAKDADGFTLGQNARAGSWLFSEGDDDGFDFGDEEDSKAPAPAAAPPKAQVADAAPRGAASKSSKKGSKKGPKPGSKGGRRRSAPPAKGGGGISFRKPSLGRSQPRRKD